MPSQETATAAIDQFFEAYGRYISTESEMYPPLTPGGVPIEEYAPLEEALGVPLPWSFKEWHRRYHARGLQVQGTYLPLSPEEAPVADLKERILALDHVSEAIPMRVVPFGYDEMTQRVIAFDARGPADGDEWPIVFMRAHHAGAPLVGAEVEHASFPDLLDGLTRVIEATLDPEEP